MGSAGNKYLPCAISKCLSNNSLFWVTDKFTVSKIVESGRSKPKLQIKAAKKAKKAPTFVEIDRV